MSRYFFHLKQATDTVDDLDGRGFADLDAAKAAAIVDLRAVICAQVTQGQLDRSSRIDITDEHGQCLAAIGLGDAVHVRGLD